MSETIVDLIAANIVTTLQTVTEASGYNATLSDVVRPGQVLRPEADLSALVILSGSIEITEDDSLTDYHYSPSWTIYISSVQPEDLEDSSETRRLRAAFDCIKALNVDVSRGNFAYDTIFSAIEMVADEGEGRFGVLLQFSTPFRSSRSDPYTQNEP